MAALKLNVYTFKYIRNKSEYALDVVAPSPEVAIDDLRRYMEANFQEGEIVEMIQIVKGGIYYKNPKRKKR